jgi:hypothetical protein
MARRINLETMDTGDGMTEEDLLKKADSLLTSPASHKEMSKNKSESPPSQSVGIFTYLELEPAAAS